MAVTVKTFTSASEAAGALSSDRSARYLGGGTLVMRALNEGDVSISTVIRTVDWIAPPFTSPETASSAAGPSPKRLVTSASRTSASSFGAGDVLIVRPARESAR